MTSPNVVLMGGHQPLLVEMDLETRQETRQASAMLFVLSADFSIHHLIHDVVN